MSDIFEHIISTYDPDDDPVESEGGMKDIG